MVVIQPTHASSRVAGLDPDLPAGPFFWRERVTELRAILDQLTEVERQSPAVSGRFDHDLIAVAGHSFGGFTCSLLLGARLHDEDFFDPRIKVGILLASTGRGGADLTPDSTKRFPFLDVDFSCINTPTLVVCGADDDPHFTPRGPDWHPDALEATRRLTLAWLRSRFAIEHAAWDKSQSALRENAASIAELILK